VNAGPPAIAVLGEMLTIFGPVAMLKLTTFDTTPFDTTVIGTVPAVAMRLANTGAVNWVELMTLVASAEPFHSTTEPTAKPAPFTVSVKAGPPAVALFGLRALISGATMNLTAFDVMPPDTTVI
jgi:hypothetical protein